MLTETGHREQRTWSKGSVIALAVLAFLAGQWSAHLPSAEADVTRAKDRETFKDGGVLANETLNASLAVLKQLDQRVARIESALLEVVDN